MPIYEYRCRKCAKTSEILVGCSDSNPPKCQFCSSQDLEKLISAPNVGSAGGSSCDAGGCCPSGDCSGPESGPVGGGCCGGMCKH